MGDFFEGVLLWLTLTVPFFSMFWAFDAIVNNRSKKVKIASVIIASLLLGGVVYILGN